jgi:hypothetical protein
MARFSSSTAVKRARLAAAGAVACVALAAPAGASAASSAWQRLGPAPGGDSFAVIAGTPYVAYTSSAGVRVAKFAGKPGKWRKVGGPVRHRSGNNVQAPTVVAGPGKTPWLTWTEATSKSGHQVRVARFSKGKWREVVGGKDPISEARPIQGDGTKTFTSSTPSLAFLGGRPYVAYIDFDGIDSRALAVRLSPNGRRWQRVSNGLSDVSINQSKLTVAGGRLFLVYHERTFDTPIYRRFDATGSTWKSLPNVQKGDSALFGGMVGFHGQLHTLFAESPSGDVFVSKLGSDDKWTNVGLHLATDPTVVPESIATDGSTLYAGYLQGVSGAQQLSVLLFAPAGWVATPQPTPTGSTVDSAALVGAAGGGVWLLAHESTAGTAKFQLELFNAAG